MNKELCHAAIAQLSAERAEFLDQAYSENASLRAAVEALWRSTKRRGLFNVTPQDVKSLDEDRNATMECDVAGERESRREGRAYFQFRQGDA
jgi:hypothetical protein